MRRVTSLLAHLRTPRGALLVVAGVSGGAAVVLGSVPGLVLGLLAVAAAGAAMLLASRRLSSQHAAIGRLTARVERAGELAHSVRAQVRIVRQDQDALRGEVVALRGEVDALTAPPPEPEPPAPEPDVITVEDRARASLQLAAELVAPRPSPAAHRGTEGEDRSSVGPEVTVVIPCFNEERYIEDAVRSVLAQGFRNWECIVVDDASTDASPRLLAAMEADDDRLTVVRHRVNGGLSASRNTGLRLARGRYVTFLDGDDMFTSDALEARLEPLRASTDDDVVGAFGGNKIVPESIRLEDLPARWPWRGGRLVDFVTAAGECPFNAHAPLCRTDVLRAAGGFDEGLRDGAEDWDLWSRLLRAGFVFIPVPATLGVYRQKPGSMVREKIERHVELSSRLLGSAYEPWDPSTSPVLASASWPAPLPEYELSLKHARRTLRSAAMALLSGDEAAARSIVASLGPVAAPVVRRHATPEEAILVGVRRLHGLSPEQAEAMRPEVAAATAAFASIVDEVLDREADVAPASAPSCEVVLVPESSAALDLLHERAGTLGLRGGDTIVLDVSRAGGDHGVAAAAAARGLRTVSLNEWCLGRWTSAHVLVTSLRTAAVDTVAAALGGEVHEVPMPQHEVLAVDEAPARSDLATSGGNPPLPVMVGDRTVETSWLREEYPATWADVEGMRRFRDVHRGERCVLIGNGPSLNELDVTLLRDEATFGVNGIFYKTDELDMDVLYYVVEDTAVMADNLERIRSYRARGHRFFPSIYREKVGERDDTTFFMMNRGFYAAGTPDFCVPRFSTDAAQRVYAGQSVTIINLQLAYWMGFTEVVLIGMDFSYTVPDDAKVEGNLITSAGDDPNHFHPDYFGKGKVWKDPKLDRVLANYQLAKLMFEADGRRIVNATAGGRLELFDRVDFDQIFR